MLVFLKERVSLVWAGGGRKKWLVLVAQTHGDCCASYSF